MSERGPERDRGGVRNQRVGNVMEICILSPTRGKKPWHHWINIDDDHLQAAECGEGEARNMEKICRFPFGTIDEKGEE